MPTAEPVSRPSPKRDHLVATALKLFYRHGYHAVGIDTILAESEVAKMTLYNHFASKDDLIVAVIELQGQKIGKDVAEALAAAGSSPKKRFIALLDWYGEWFKTPNFNGCAMIRAVAEYPDQASPVHQAVMREKAKGAARIQSLLTEMGVRSAPELALQIHLLLEGAIVRAHTFGDPGAATLAKKAALALISG